MSTGAIDFDAVRAAARQLEQGKLVAFPTETVYGLGADAENPAAVAKIYAAKGRPSNHPVIVHVAPGADLSYWAANIPAQAQALVAAFWPGPLTLILQRADRIPDAVSGGQASIGLRCPSHPVAQALLREFKAGQGGLAAPSANRFGHVSPTTAQHVRDEFGEGDASPLASILDGGQSEVGIESTIVDLSRIETHGPVLLRPGHITAAAIADVIGILPAQPDAAAPRASGTLDAHYAPATPVALVETGELPATTEALQRSGLRFAVISHSIDSASLNAASGYPMASSAYAYAHDLYAALRTMDGVHADIILVERPPQQDDWNGVNDRLRRAAFDSAGVLNRMLGKH